jgi:hypothetical protein
MLTMLPLALETLRFTATALAKFQFQGYICDELLSQRTPKFRKKSEPMCGWH